MINHGISVRALSGGSSAEAGTRDMGLKLVFQEFQVAAPNLLAGLTVMPAANGAIIFGPQGVGEQGGASPHYRVIITVAQMNFGKPAWSVIVFF